MPVPTTFEIQGDSDELFAQHQEIVVPLAETIAAENGGISSTIVKTDDGLMIVNHRETREGIEKTSTDDLAGSERS